MPHYRAYGIEFTSELELPLFPEGAGTEPGASISLGPVDDNPGEGGFRFRNWYATPDRLLFDARGIGRMLVAEGRSIRVDRAPGATENDIASIVLGTGVATLLMQRRMLPLHACAIATPAGAVLTIGRSGAGKSTLLAGFLDAGYAMLADDVTGLTFDADGTPVAHPCRPAIRLWDHSLALLGRTAEGLEPVREGLAKYLLPVERFHGDPMPIRAIVYLSDRNVEAPTFKPLEHLHRVECLSRFIFRKNFLRGLHLQRFAFDAMVALARRVEMMAVSRPGGSVDPLLLARAVIDRVDASPAAAASP